MPEGTSLAELYVAPAAIPHVTVRLKGVIQHRGPKTPPKLMVRINGEAVREYQAKHTNSAETELLSGDSDLDDLEDTVDQLDTDTDSDDGPDWMFEAGETSVRDPLYTFCPPPHRKPLLHLFTKHFCYHPFFPLRDGTTRTAAEFEEEAVLEMYTYCKTRGLREVWAYMYNCWYCPVMWKLWARSSKESYLPRLRTTMNVENFWKQLKHEQLHHLLHPRLDQLVFILINKVSPMYLN
ncbi:hypothetical protein V5O48_018010 [Marasmius crinis-equi]|uniref:PiggyBac transposable element-derived protein domain-containing protein n=1 Tax=Marasmius crinis-equi TaxID=585013 RepID=A0ABR3EME5_9AGAR